MKLKTLAIVLGLLSSSFAFSQEIDKNDTLDIQEEVIEMPEEILETPGEVTDTLNVEEAIDTLNVLDQRLTLLEDAVQTGKKLKVSGYIQAQWESTDTLGSLKVGAGKNPNESDSYNRFGVRRGRIKLAYEDAGNIGVIQFDLTEKGVALKDAYLSVLDPWGGYASIKGGVFDRPFGYEISYSSSRRESPERSRVFQTLFPDERDLGGMFTLQAPKTSPWNVLKLEAGLFSGNGIYLDTDSKKDLIGHLSYNKSESNLKYGFGASFYSGSVSQANKYVYTMDGGLFKVDSTATNKNSFAKRQYVGIDAQISLESPIGLTTLRGEYLTGKQPGRSDNSSSPKSGLIPGFDTDNKTAKLTDTYIRNFAGAYLHLTQDIGETKHSLTFKFDFYDPNTSVSGMEVGAGTSASGLKKTNKTDVAYSTLGVGYLYRMNNNVRIMAYYDMNVNEKTAVADYTKDRADNVFTLRFQYKF